VCSLTSLALRTCRYSVKADANDAVEYVLDVLIDLVRAAARGAIPILDAVQFRYEVREWTPKRWEEELPSAYVANEKSLEITSDHGCCGATTGFSIRGVSGGDAVSFKYKGCCDDCCKSKCCQTPAQRYFFEGQVLAVSTVAAGTCASCECCIRRETIKPPTGWTSNGHRIHPYSSTTTMETWLQVPVPKCCDCSCLCDCDCCTCQCCPSCACICCHTFVDNFKMRDDDAGPERKYKAHPHYAYLRSEVPRCNDCSTCCRPLPHGVKMPRGLPAVGRVAYLAHIIGNLEGVFLAGESK
jgi:hypothetical protein